MIHCTIEMEDYTQYAIDEGVSLLDTYGAKALKVFRFGVKKINPATYIRKGQVEQAQQAVNELGVDFIYWNSNIRDRNQRELEKVFLKPVLDRTQVILEIFKQRAFSSEEKLQVALAEKKYQRAKIIKAWTHLERQKGASATVGGPGEKQLELDRRMVDEKIKVYTQKVKKMQSSRIQQRKTRVKAPIISLIGYTNVGKSTLFNLLTKSNVIAENKLFATLGPNIRRFSIDARILIADTVGFIRNFPALLSNAFGSTLEEIKYSTLILHLRDIKMPFEENYSKIALETVNKFGPEIPIINIWTKWDEASQETEPLDALDGIKISSKTGLGIAELKKLILNKCFPVKEQLAQ